MLFWSIYSLRYLIQDLVLYLQEINTDIKFPCNTSSWFRGDLNASPSQKVEKDKHLFVCHMSLLCETGLEKLQIEACWVNAQLTLNWLLLLKRSRTSMSSSSWMKKPKAPFTIPFLKKSEPQIPFTDYCTFHHWHCVHSDHAPGMNQSGMTCSLHHSVDQHTVYIIHVYLMDIV